MGNRLDGKELKDIWREIERVMIMNTQNLFMN